VFRFLNVAPMFSSAALSNKAPRKLLTHVCHRLSCEVNTGET